MVKDFVPCVHFYDQDFVDMYDRTWVWIEENWKGNAVKPAAAPQEGYLFTGEENRRSLFDSCLSSLFLVYSNQKFDPCAMIDYFYSVQDEDGRISDCYDTTTGKPVTSDDNPLGIRSGSLFLCFRMLSISSTTR